MGFLLIEGGMSYEGSIAVSNIKQLYKEGGEQNEQNEF